jgi:SAM-dependent methyltransferase
MTNQSSDMSTDAAWEEWGRRDPYFGVITDPRFRRSRIDEDAEREFFASGGPYVQHVLTKIRKHINPEFVPRSVLDFGCGVGRLLGAFAAIAEDVVGVDVSKSMLQEASRNCNRLGLHNVRLLQSDDDLSQVTGTFDLVHSFIVFQHIPVERGRAIFGKLLRYIRPGGVGAIHLTYSKTRYAATYGVAPPELPLPQAAAPVTPNATDPEMQMNPYNLNSILFLMQCRGVQEFHVEFSDHGGELGAFLFFSVNA